jgi:hypothetical protein
MGRRVIQHKFANVSEEYTASIFRVERKQAAKRIYLDQNTWLRCRLGKNPRQNQWARETEYSNQCWT